MNTTQMVRPEPDTQPTLQSCDRDCFGPRLSGQESDHDAVVDPGCFGGAASAPLPHRLTQVQHQKADHLGVRVVARLVGPVLTADRWSSRRVTSHPPSVGGGGTVDVLPHTNVGDGLYGVEYHQSNYRHGTRRATRRTSSAVVCIPFRTTGERR